MKNYEATIQEILLPSSDNLNDYVAQNYRKYTDLDGKNKTNVICAIRLINVIRQ